VTDRQGHPLGKMNNECESDMVLEDNAAGDKNEEQKLTENKQETVDHENSTAAEKNAEEQKNKDKIKEEFEEMKINDDKNDKRKQNFLSEDTEKDECPVGDGMVETQPDNVWTNRLRKRRKISFSDAELAKMLQQQEAGVPANPIGMANFDQVDLVDILIKSQAPPEFITGSFTCFSVQTRNRDELEEGNKVILPASVLSMVDIGNSHSPLLFQMKKHMDADECTYCGVLEFTADETTVVAPFWMMQKLQITDGETVQLTRCQSLPRGTFVKFQPLTSEFASLPNPKATLETYLGWNFSTLTKGETITIRQDDQKYSLIVKECRPEDSISIVETSLRVEFDDAVAGPKIVHEVIPLTSEKMKRTVEPGSANYYMILLDKNSLNDDIVLQCVALKGDPDLYVDQKYNFPSLKHHTWASEEKGDSVLFIPVDDPHRRVGSVFYVSVIGHDGPAEYEIFASKATVVEPTTMEMDGNKATNEDDKPKDGHQKCENCHKWIPQISFDRHDAFCRRNNFKCTFPGCDELLTKNTEGQHYHCPVCSQLCEKDDPHYHCEYCSKVIKQSGKDKHMAVAHSNITCECGIEVERESYKIHCKFECPNRKELCKFCERPVVFSEMIFHVEKCAATTTECDICGKIVIWKKIEIHYAAEHGKIYQGKAAAPIVNTELGEERSKTINAYKVANEKMMKHGESILGEKTTTTISTMTPQSNEKKKTQTTTTTTTSNTATTTRNQTGYACPQCGLMCSSMDEVSEHMITTCIALQFD